MPPPPRPPPPPFTQNPHKRPPLACAVPLPAIVPTVRLTDPPAPPPPWSPLPIQPGSSPSADSVPLRVNVPGTVAVSTPPPFLPAESPESPPPPPPPSVGLNGLSVEWPRPPMPRYCWAKVASVGKPPSPACEPPKPCLAPPAAVPEPRNAAPDRPQPSTLTSEPAETLAFLALIFTPVASTKAGMVADVDPISVFALVSAWSRSFGSGPALAFCSASGRPPSFGWALLSPPVNRPAMNDKALDSEKLPMLTVPALA